MTRLLALTAIFSLASYDYVGACGGSEKFASRGSFGVPVASVGVPMVNPMSRGMAVQQAQFAMSRQAAYAQAAAYNARMQPIRYANANRARQERLAHREARKEVRLAKLEAKRQAEQIFLAKARTWTDSTGNHQVVAILADANAWGVKLQKQDGSTVNVPMENLSSPDQSVAAAFIARGMGNGVMLAGL